MSLEKKQRQYAITGVIFLSIYTISMVAIILVDYIGHHRAEYYRIPVFSIILCVIYVFCVVSVLLYRKKAFMPISFGLLLGTRLFSIASIVSSPVDFYSHINYIHAVIGAVLRLIPIILIFAFVLLYALKRENAFFTKLWFLPIIVCLPCLTFSDIFGGYPMYLFLIYFIQDILLSFGFVFVALLCSVESRYLAAQEKANKQAALAEASAQALKEQETLVEQYAVVGSAEQLMNYKKLLDMDMITQEEFNQKKKEVLDL